jgi:hypothetical protein
MLLPLLLPQRPPSHCSHAPDIVEARVIVSHLRERHRLAIDRPEARVGKAVEGQLHELLVDIALVLVPVAPCASSRQGGTSRNDQITAPLGGSHQAAPSAGERQAGSAAGAD